LFWLGLAKRRIQLVKLFRCGLDFGDPGVEIFLEVAIALNFMPVKPAPL
jgi:hypothetical protein